MRTNIVLDDELVRRAQELTGIKTKKEVVDEALRTLIAVRRRPKERPPDESTREERIEYRAEDSILLPIDRRSLRVLQIVIDNLLDREPEPEDEFLASWDTLRQLSEEVEETPPTPDWRQRLEDL